MAVTTWENEDQEVTLRDDFLGQGAAISILLDFTGEEMPSEVQTIQVFLERVADEGEENTAADAMAAWLGTTEFGGDIAQKQVDPDFLVAGEPSSFTITFDTTLAEEVRDSGQFYFTLFAPATRNVKTGHVEDESSIFGQTRVKTVANVIFNATPLRLHVQTFRRRPAVTADVVAIDDADHEYFTRILQTGLCLKKTRITVWDVNFGTVAPPYPTVADLPTITNPRVLREAISYQITRTDQFVADQLTLTMSMQLYVAYSTILKENCLITVDEKWIEPVASQPTDWMRIGTFFMDTATDTDGQGRTINVVGRDAIKLMVTNQVAERFWPDRIFVPRRKLQKVRDGFTDGLPYHVYTDGPATNHTVMWATSPLPRLFRSATPTRIIVKNGSMEIIFRNGELLIERQYHNASANHGGLNNPAWIEAEYYRWAQPSDEVVTKVTSVAAASVVLQEGVSERWKGCTLILLTGNAKHRRYQISSVNVATRTVFVSGYTPLADGVEAGDRVQAVYSNLAEQMVRRVLLGVGFQDLDESKPFYIENVAKPSVNPIQIPGTPEYDFRYQKARSGFEILEQVRREIPPNVLYRTNALGNIETVVLEQSETADYTWEDATAASNDSRDAEIATRFVYRVRDRTYSNLVSYTSGTLAAITFNPQIIPQTSVPLMSLISHAPPDFLTNLPPQERWRRMMVDGNEQTRVSWSYEALPNTPTELLNRINGLELVRWELTRVFTLREIQFRAPRKEWISTLWLDIEVSEDGENWATATDEFTFSSKDDNLRTFELAPDTTAKYIRLIVTSAARVRNDRGTLSRIAAGIADLFVYADDIVEGIAELGVDRFPGESDEAFARDVALRQRLGRRTAVLQQIDERGHEISALLGMSIVEYAQARALEYLAESVTEFDNVPVTGIRPDLVIGSTIAVAAERLALQTSPYIVRQAVTHSDGRVDALLVNYRPADGVGGGTVSSFDTGTFEDPEDTLTTTNPPPSSTSTTTSTTTTLTTTQPPSGGF